MTGRLVVFNCPATPVDHLESELFGTTRGAFTGALDRPGAAEQASSGLLVLDEIGAMALVHQAKILRLLENREARRLGAVESYCVQASFAALTNEDPGDAVRTGRLREDLYYRLAQDAVLRVPSLRERLEDVPLLAQLALDEMGAFALTPAAIGALEEHPWPGNVRELRAVVRTAARLAIREAGGAGPCQLQQAHVEMALAKISLTPTLQNQ
jgi:arginine utilization regulatory protein